MTLCAWAALALLTVHSSHAAATLAGEVTGDGLYDVTDIVTLLNEANNTESELFGEGLLIFDADLSGDIDGDDAAYIAGIILGLNQPKTIISEIDVPQVAISIFRQEAPAVGDVNIRPALISYWRQSDATIAADVNAVPRSVSYWRVPDPTTGATGDNAAPRAISYRKD